MSANTQFAEDLSKTVHMMLWRRLKPQILAVRTVLYRADLLYHSSDVLPPELGWVRLWGIDTSRLSVDGRGRFFIADHDRRRDAAGLPVRQLEIPAMFIEATPAECRSLTHRLLADHLRTVEDPEALRSRQGREESVAARCRPAHRPILRNCERRTCHER